VQSLDHDMLEYAADRSIVDGDTVLRQLMRGESELPGEWDYLTGFRSKDEQPPPEDEAIFRRSDIASSSRMKRACGGCGCH
jgi:hypothetical protein